MDENGGREKMEKKKRKWLNEECEWKEDRETWGEKRKIWMKKKNGNELKSNNIFLI